MFCAHARTLPCMCVHVCACARVGREQAGAVALMVCWRICSTALDAHCAGLRAALAGIEAASIEADMGATGHATQDDEISAALADIEAEIGATGRATQDDEVNMGDGSEIVQHQDEEQDTAEASGVKEATAQEASDRPRHNQCFSPLPTASPSGDRLAIQSSPQLTAPAVQHLLKQHDEFMQQQLLLAHQPAAQGQQKSGARQQHRQHAHKSTLAPIPEIGRVAYPAAVEQMLSIVVLAAALVSRTLGGSAALQWPPLGTALVAAANLGAGLYLVWRSMRLALAHL